MITPDELYNKLTELADYIRDLPDKIKLIPEQITIVQGLSEISESLGTVSAGEFRVGNQIQPGEGFTGMRMAWPSLEYDSGLWNLVGVNNDVLQFGVNAETGELIAGGGLIKLNANGLDILCDTGSTPIIFYHDTDIIGRIYANPAFDSMHYVIRSEDIGKQIEIRATHPGGVTSSDVPIYPATDMRHIYIRAAKVLGHLSVASEIDLNAFNGDISIKTNAAGTSTGGNLSLFGYTSLGISSLEEIDFSNAALGYSHRGRLTHLGYLRFDENSLATDIPSNVTNQPVVYADTDKDLLLITDNGTTKLNSEYIPCDPFVSIESSTALAVGNYSFYASDKGLPSDTYAIAYRLSAVFSTNNGTYWIGPILYHASTDIEYFTGLRNFAMVYPMETGGIMNISSDGQFYYRASGATINDVELDAIGYWK